MQRATALKTVAQNRKMPLSYRVACAKKYQALLTELCALRAKYGMPVSDKCRARMLNQNLRNIGKVYSQGWA
jgi:hypothetical protein